MTNLKKKLNDFKGDEVVVIDGVEVEAVVEGEDEAEIQVEDEVQVHEQGLVEVQVQAEDEASVVGEMAIVVGVSKSCLQSIYINGSHSNRSS